MGGGALDKQTRGMTHRIATRSLKKINQAVVVRVPNDRLQTKGSVLTFLRTLIAERVDTYPFDDI
jgi:hypothetical protein